MSRVARTTPPEDAERFALFLARADKIAQHPLAAALANGASPDFKLFMQTATPWFDLNHAPMDSWAHLATLVRPVIFLENEPIKLEGILNRVASIDRGFAESTRDLKDKLAKWRTHGFFGIQIENGPNGEKSPPDSKFELTRVWTAPVGTPLPLLDAPMVWDYELADVYFNGELFHSNPEHARRLAEAGDMELGAFRKAAEFRTIRCTPYIAKAAQVIRWGQKNGKLPVS